ncbi:MAG TPA: DUF2555 domain-containing protein [Cyanothece sp. UBA12306]|nr:DUF2555 domain-containing protein [Cyanothece sp. UBA12306]
MTVLGVTRQEISALTEKDISALAQRLEQDDYNNPFEALNDWHLLRAIAFQREDLAEPYLYLLDIEAYDEA